MRKLKGMFMEVERRKNLYGFEQREYDDRRLPDDQERKVNIKQLWQRSHEILRLSLLGFGAPEIAEMLSIHERTVSNTINSDLGMAKLSELRTMRDLDSVDVAKEVAKLFPKALQVYKDILDSENAGMNIKKQTADTLLMDIGGHKAPSKVQGQFAHAHASIEELEEIKKRGRAAAKDCGFLVSESEDERSEGA